MTVLSEALARRDAQGTLRCLFVVSFCLLCFAIGCAQFSGAPAEGFGGEGGVEPAAFDPEEKTQIVHAACAVDVSHTIAALPWELTVDPGPIVAGEAFAVRFDGVAFFDEGFADAGNSIIPGGAKEVHLIDMRASVAAHMGASGPVAELTNAPIPYQCTLENPPGTRPSCDPRNDLEGAPGFVGNTDCEPIGNINPCGRFIPIPTSDDCSIDGVCWNLGRDVPDILCSEDDFCRPEKKEQCMDNGFCVTGDVIVPLATVVQEYVADPSGDVRFGWYIDRDQPWSVPEPLFSDPLEPTGFRIRVSVFPVAFGCGLGELDDTGRVGPVPDSKLITFSISQEKCPDGTRVCPEGFAAANNGVCVFSEEDATVFAQDPMGSVAVCDDLPGPAAFWSYLPISDSSVLSSPSLIVRGDVQAKDAQSDSCKHDANIIAMANYQGANGERLRAVWIVLDEKPSTTASWSATDLRAVEIVLTPEISWSSSSEVCCERSFQTTWTVTVAQCEGW